MSTTINTDELLDSITKEIVENKPKKEPSTFLHESQIEGKMREEDKDLVAKKNLDEAIAEVSKIMVEEEAQALRDIAPEDWPTAKLQIYCHDCRAIVPAGLGRTPKGKPRTVCGSCSSRKISSGTQEALTKFYHLDKPRPAKFDRPKRDFSDRSKYDKPRGDQGKGIKGGRRRRR